MPAGHEKNLNSWQWHSAQPDATQVFASRQHAGQCDEATASQARDAVDDSRRIQFAILRLLYVCVR